MAKRAWDFATTCAQTEHAAQTEVRWSVGRSVGPAGLPGHARGHRERTERTEMHFLVEGLGPIHAESVS